MSVQLYQQPPHPLPAVIEPDNPTVEWTCLLLVVGVIVGLFLTTAVNYLLPAEDGARSLLWLLLH